MSEQIVWHPISLAPAEEEVWTKIDDERGERNVQKLTRRGRLWFTGTQDNVGMYVYYTPTHWAHLSPTPVPNSQAGEEK